MAKNNVNIVTLANNDGCFDLQFRKDTRHERTNSPTYYRWKAQFVITAPKENIKILERIKKNIGCGSVSVTKGQARFSVQKIDDIVMMIIPYFNKNALADNKKKDFDLWQKAVQIIHQNKGKYLSKWKRNDLMQLIQIHTSTAKYKHKPKKAKWLEMAKTLTNKN
ncbi:MAG: hypothetical protein A3A98_02760 [Candidatus Staskawiczbacteria bacterium RIFCSPLOWO2_01_FULL_40_39]|uniref:Homing endonuclease LAGLIDADG domain-containing protein n=1 Tax=Candidatus Staskawiczbacteria bacterium RIFCSPHIGHO2_01_FULL_39_25 TaxID=1802202 RepID=A0A1G2HMJ6_9BACT|nr:MAG: hypothetical protein A2730_03660 [Candidatus Staskawiczbacteria bacterium RIFCSPHIGHO2_01_FULL_39_25]OGZ73668.1 MAG: hypothetical protein A3A98_02760 [Candidatus Staskawiczbacteria bacterium RIFCSPLOWO2_01_FULL_40_39]OGZ75294.1 MAG: hypothetical protein A3I87_02070 [Candidatus Staskawiczbacteria bacterium RIFCSPLOWO2_02_FULL_39_8]